MMFAKLMYSPCATASSRVMRMVGCTCSSMARRYRSKQSEIPARGASGRFTRSAGLQHQLVRRRNEPAGHCCFMRAAARERIETAEFSEIEFRQLFEPADRDLERAVLAKDEVLVRHRTDQIFLADDVGRGGDASAALHHRHDFPVFLRDQDAAVRLIIVAKHRTIKNSDLQIVIVGV